LQPQTEIIINRENNQEMEFNPNNNIIKLCIEAMNMEEKGKPAEASKLFLQAWNEATNDFEKYIAAYYVARHQENTFDKLKWLETALQFALKVNNDSVKGAFPSLYSNIAKCYEDLNDHGNAKKNYELANSFKSNPSDKGPFYHGTKADMQIGDMLTAGRESNYKSEFIMNHIYFTQRRQGAKAQRFFLASWVFHFASWRENYFFHSSSQQRLKMD